MLVSSNGELLDRAAIISGMAAAEATSAISAKHPEWAESYRLLGRTGLTVSGAGFGTYRVDRRVQAHRAALAKAIRMGVNIIEQYLYGTFQCHSKKNIF